MNEANGKCGVAYTKSSEVREIGSSPRGTVSPTKFLSPENRKAFRSAIRSDHKKAPTL
jgi:hypothetical protein